MVNRTELANRAFALFVGAVLIIVGTNANVRESVSVLLLLIGLLFVSAAVAGEITFTIRTGGKTRLKAKTPVAGKAKEGKGAMAAVRGLAHKVLK